MNKQLLNTLDTYVLSSRKKLLGAGVDATASPSYVRGLICIFDV